MSDDKQLDFDELKRELDEFKIEKERVRKIIGEIGGAHNLVLEKIVNWSFVISMIIIFIFSVFTGWIDHLVSLEVGVLLVSAKIVWMMYQQQKVNHFQFWILTSLEYKINELQKKTNKIFKMQKEAQKHSEKL